MISKHLYLIMTDDIPSQLAKTFCSNALQITIQTGPESHNIFLKNGIIFTEIIITFPNFSAKFGINLFEKFKI